MLHHSVAPRLARMQPRRDTSVRWVYPSLDKAMMEVGLKKVERYVLHCQNTITQYIATWKILEICLETERWPGAQAVVR